MPTWVGSLGPRRCDRLCRVHLGSRFPSRVVARFLFLELLDSALLDPAGGDPAGSCVSPSFPTPPAGSELEECMYPKSWAAQKIVGVGWELANSERCSMTAGWR